ncbi:MAG: ABC transporter substrate-binding protein, partial [Myxococcota bacterium]
FDSVGLLVDAMKRAGSVDPAEVRAALAETTDYQGIVGPISYRNGSRVPIKPVSVIEVRDGEKTAIWTVTPPQ